MRRSIDLGKKGVGGGVRCRPWYKAVVIGSALVVLVGMPSSVAAGQRTRASGGSITVAVAFPSPPPNMLKSFTKDTGITVHWVNVDWDSLQTKIAAAAEAHAYYADVTDVDWSKVGEYHDLNWFYPLNKYFPLSTLKGKVPQLNSFIDDGEIVGIPMDSSFLVTTINMKDFAKAGITKMPTTLSQYTADLKEVKGKGVVAHPLDIPLQAQEGLSTYWYELTGAYGGTVLTKSDKPNFTAKNSPGYRALQWIVSAYKSGLVPPGNIDDSDVQGIESAMAHNQTASAFSEYSGDVATVYDVPSDSSVVGQVRYIATPGLHGPGPNLSEPDGVGIPRTARNVRGAVTFIKWLDSPKNQALFAGADGGKGVIEGFPLPASYSAMKTLTQTVKGEGMDEMSVLLRHSSAIFPGGAPSWYASFSTAVQTNVHSAAAGDESVAKAISAIAQVVNSQ